MFPSAATTRLDGGHASLVRAERDVVERRLSAVSRQRKGVTDPRERR
jgi:hypothetical protein